MNVESTVENIIGVIKGTEICFLEDKDKNLFDTLGFDSIECIELIQRLEDEFKCEIRDDEIVELLNSMNSIVAIIKRKLKDAI